MVTFKALEELMYKLVDTRSPSIKIQVSDIKSAPSSFKPLEEALTYKFIRFGNAHFIPAISVDIDTHQDLGLIAKTVTKYKLPTPNFLVKTTKGLHIHWVLDKAVSTKHLPSIRLYQRIADEIMDAFGSDIHAMPKHSGRMFRNPLEHETVFFTKTLHSLKEFTHLLKEKVELPHKGSVSRASTRGYKIPDFTKITEGSRNSVLFDYGRHTAYRFGNKVGLEQVITSAITRANSLLPQPLPHLEITAIVTSIYTFMQTKYKGRTTNQKLIEFNRNLAARQSKLKQVELLKKWVSLGILSIKHLKAMSYREGGRVFRVSPQTFKKHKEALVRAFQDLPLVSLKALKDFKIDSIPTFDLYDLLYIPLGSTTNVKCNGPPLAA